jgi:hypothetical protein
LRSYIKRIYLEVLQGLEEIILRAKPERVSWLIRLRGGWWWWLGIEKG